MSDISVLSNQYDQLVETSVKINSSVIALKKKNLLNDHKAKLKYPRLEVSAKEVDDAKAILLPFLDNIKKILKDEYLQSDFVPTAVLLDYKRRLSSNAYLQEDIEEVEDGIKDNKILTEEDLNVLDTILSIIDNERNTLFRKLRKARG